MKTIWMGFLCLAPGANAQNTIANDVVEGGKAVIELIRVLKTPKAAMAASVPLRPDSCSLYRLSDISFKNKTAKTIYISLYYRVGNRYDSIPLTLSVAPGYIETLYEIRSGIYKYRVETGDNEEKTLLHEGELKLNPCQKRIREIKS